MGTDAVNVGGRMVGSSEAGTQAAQEAARIREQQNNGGGGGGGGCFPSNTNILTPSGWRHISVINPGEPVLTVDSNGDFQRQVVIKRKDHRPKPLASIVDRSGKELLRVTRAHSVLTVRGWLRVADLRDGDVLSYLVADDRKLTTVTVGAVLDTQDVETVHNLIVAGSYSFVAQGYVAHSFSYCRTLRMAVCEFTVELDRVITRLRGDRGKKLA